MKTVVQKLRQMAASAEPVIHEISRMTTRYILFLAMNYIDKPDQRGTIREETERFVN